jgi:hypothetical protein
MANSNYMLQVLSYKGYYNNDNRDASPATLVPIYQSNQCYQDGSKNIRLLFARRGTKEIGQNQGRYSQSEIPFPTNREIIGKGLIMKKKEMSLRLSNTRSRSINKIYSELQ